MTTFYILQSNNTLHLIRVAPQRRTTLWALIKFVQQIPKSHHDTVKEEAAEEP